MVFVSFLGLHGISKYFAAILMLLPILVLHCMNEDLPCSVESFICLGVFYSTWIATCYHISLLHCFSGESFRLLHTSSFFFLAFLYRLWQGSRFCKIDDREHFWNGVVWYLLPSLWAQTIENNLSAFARCFPAGNERLMAPWFFLKPSHISVC